MTRVAGRIGALRASLNRGVLRRLPWRRQRTTVVVEWAGTWLKLAQVVATPNGKRLSRLEARTIPSPEALPEMLRELVAEATGTGRGAEAVIISTPRNLVTVRNLRLPSTDPAELKEMVGLQAASLTPYAKEEIITSFRTVRKTTPDGTTDVMLGIVNREVSYQRLKVLEDAHLKVRGIRLSSDGLLQWQGLAPGHDGPVALVDVDTHFTDFAVVADRQLLFTKMLPIGAGKVAAGQEPWLKQFMEEMKTALDLYEHEGLGGPITKAVLTGAALEVAGLEQNLRDTFGLAVERASVLEKVPGALEAFGDSAPQRAAASFTAVIGLAWNPDGAEIDLTPLEVSQREGLAKRGRDLVVMGVLLLSLLIVLSGFISERFYVKRQYLEQLRQEVLRTRAQADEVERLRKETRIVKGLTMARNTSLEMLSELYRILPPEIYLTAVTFRAGDTLMLKGVAEEMSHVFQFVSVLEKQPAFSQVKVRQVATKGAEANKKQADFEVVCTLRPHREDQAVAL